MKFEVIEASSKVEPGNEISGAKDMRNKLAIFQKNHPNAKVLSMAQSSYVPKVGAPCTMLTICYDEPGEPGIRRL